MELSGHALLSSAVLVFLVALLYSSVGHGGASGYLAVLSLLAASPSEMTTTALILNVLVAGIAFATFTRAGHFSFPLTWPFTVASVPAAFLGGMAHVTDHTYFLLLAIALIAAAVRLVVDLPTQKKEFDREKPGLAAVISAGVGVGLLSGIVGIGGGVFLSPLMILAGWADPKQAAATSACFIVANSIAGLGGRFLHGGVHVGILYPLLLAAFLGGLVGSRLGASNFTATWLRRALAVVILIAVGKLL